MENLYLVSYKYNILCHYPSEILSTSYNQDLQDTVNEAELIDKIRSKCM